MPTTHPSGLRINHEVFAGDDCEKDNPYAATMQSVHKVDLCDANLYQNGLVGSNNFYLNSNQISAKSSVSSCNTANSKTASMYSLGTSQTLKRTTALNTGESIMQMQIKPKPQETDENSYTPTTCSGCYKKSTYVVLVGDRLRTCNTKLYASLPLQNKYMVKQRVQDSTGATKIKLVLKSTHERYTL